MNELSKHIEFLLLKHNCVIVPGLGGFVTQYVPARVVAEEELYLPPCRSVGFNPQLTLNDGLLAQSYMQAHDTSYPETMKLIEEAVDGVKLELQRRGELELHGIGRLRLALDGRYGFEPCEAGLLSPRLYGLDAFSIRPLAGSSATTGARSGEAVPKSAPPRKRKNTYTLRIDRELANYAAAAIVAVMSYLFWATPVAVETRGGESAASMAFIPVRTAPAASRGQGGPSARPAQADTGNAAPTAASGTDIPPQAEGTYTIVLASAISLKNASIYVDMLRDSGIEGSSVSRKGTMVRVVYGQYPTEAEAYAELNRQHARSRYFENAWVMKQR